MRGVLLRPHFLPLAIFNLEQFRSTFCWLRIATALGDTPLDSKCCYRCVVWID
jgi:hypothetical protein